MWLLDCGEATQHRIMKARLKAKRIERILLTHLHGDHCYGLPGMLSAMAIQERSEPVDIVGPVGLREMLTTILRLSDAAIPFPVTITELTPGEATTLPERSGWSLAAYPIAHRLPCFGYVLEEAPRPGAFHPHRAKALGVPSGPLWGRLQQGESITLDDGRTIAPHEVSDPPRRGRKVVLLGDTNDASGVAAAGQGCDLLVHETTYDAGRPEKAAQWGHSTSVMTGRFAAAIGAKTVIITHFSARYTDTSSRQPLRVEDLVRETAACCPGTSVLAAHDLWSYAVPVPT